MDYVETQTDEESHETTQDNDTNNSDHKDARSASTNVEPRTDSNDSTSQVTYESPTSSISGKKLSLNSTDSNESDSNLNP